MKLNCSANTSSQRATHQSSSKYGMPPRRITVREPRRVLAAKTLLGGARHQPLVVSWATSGTTAANAVVEGKEETKKSDQYSETMQKRMANNSLTYRHEDGINYARVLPDLIVGSCLQTPADVDRLAEQEGVATVFCLQEDSDMAYFNLDVAPIQARCAERGDIKHVRFRIRDFDPYDLRRKLPKAVSRLAREHDPSRGTVYIHCTAGLGRAPATALAYMYWVRGIQLDEAYAKLLEVRRCGPKVEAIRSATADLLLGQEPIQATITVHRPGDAQRVQVAGLDVGWHNPLDMEFDTKRRNFVLKRLLYPGTYQYKLIADGIWTYSADHPTVQDGNNINNILEVLPAHMDPEAQASQLRYLTPGSRLTDAEQQELRSLLCPWATHSGWVPPVEPRAGRDLAPAQLASASTDGAPRCA